MGRLTFQEADLKVFQENVIGARVKSGQQKLKSESRSKYGNKKTICEDENIRINIKPISVNESFQGRRFKTKAHNIWVKRVMVLLPIATIPEPPYEIYFKFGFSSSMSDWDNCIKAAQDCIARKYKFNDKKIRRGVVEIEIVKRGNEFFEFKISHLET